MFWKNKIYTVLTFGLVCFYGISTIVTLCQILFLHSIIFQTFLYRHLKLSWALETSVCYCYTSWDDWPIFMISGSNEQLQQQLEYTLLRPDYHSWWISKMQSGREDTLEERYAIKFCFKLGKNATETYGMLQTAFSTILHESSMCFWVA